MFECKLLPADSQAKLLKFAWGPIKLASMDDETELNELCEFFQQLNKDENNKKHVFHHFKGKPLDSQLLPISSYQVSHLNCIFSLLFCNKSKFQLFATRAYKTQFYKPNLVIKIVNSRMKWKNVAVCKILILYTRIKSALHTRV